ncbi:MAG: hypothetical protein LBR30_00845 [Clostridioides sp.]|jgi:hypothetical protein|nr:hypothetical protein [Clostridioides sp.]
MKFKIGFISSEKYNFYNVLEETKSISDVCDIEIIHISEITNFDELYKLVKKLSSVYDALLTNDSYLYLMIISHAKKLSVPFTFLRIDEGDFYKSVLIDIMNNGNINPRKIFSDFFIFGINYYDINSFLGKNYFNIFQTFDEYDIPFSINYEALDPSNDDLAFQKIRYSDLAINLYHYENELLNCHINLFKHDLIEISVTSSHYIYEELKKRNYRCIFMRPSTESILNTFKFIIRKLEQIKFYENKVATGIITIDSSKFTIDKFILDGEDIVNELYFRTKKFLQKQGYANIQLEIQSMKIILSTTQKVLLKATNNFSDFFFDELLNKLHCKINIGFGIGNTKSHSESNARMANIKSAELGSNCYFAIKSNNDLIGPVYPHYKYNNNTNNVFVEELASKIPLSTNNIYKIMSVVDERGSNKVTSKILSDYLKVTIRTANRFLNILQNAGIATLVDNNEDSKERGRPEKIYNIDFSISLEKLKKF